MDHKLKLFILACTIAGSLSILCEYCVDNMDFIDFLPGYGNCSAPVILNCSALGDNNCTPGSPDYDNCTRDTIPGCFKASTLYADANGTQQVGQVRSCAFPTSTDAQVCSQVVCYGALSSFNETNSTNTLVSCAAECCFNDTCNQGAALAVSTVPPTASTTPTSLTATSLYTHHTHNTTSHVHDTSLPTVQVSHPYLVGLLWLGVVSLL